MDNIDHLKELVSIYGDNLEEIVGAIGNKVRLQILSSLMKNPQEFNELQRITSLSKTALAHHLETLVNAALICNTSRGKYKITTDGSNLLTTILTAYEESIRKKQIESKKRADHLEKLYAPIKDTTANLVVQFIRLPAMRVVSFDGISESPENTAMLKLRAWAEPKGLFSDPEAHPIFGFDNPCPLPGKKEYGYEFWIKVDSNFKSEEVVIKDIPAGFYAVTRCIANDPYTDIPNTWKKLIQWVKDKGYKPVFGNGLEKDVSSSTSGNFILDLYFPLDEASVRVKK